MTLCIDECHSILGAAVETESLEITSLLLDAGCKVNVRNFGPRRGQTALYIAANMGNVELVKLLVKAKSDLNMQWINGEYDKALKNCFFSSNPTYTGKS